MSISTMPPVRSASAMDLLATMPMKPQGKQKGAENASESSAANEKDRQKIIRIQKEMKNFEAMFVSVLIKEMRKSAGELFPGDSSDALGSLFDQHMSQEISEAGGLGLSQHLEQYFATLLRDLESKDEAAKAEGAKAEGAKVEGAKAESAKVEGAKTEVEPKATDSFKAKEIVAKAHYGG